MVCLQKSINTSGENSKVDTYFISMVATDKFGRPARHDYLFDLTTKRKLQRNPGVKFITVNDLLDFYYNQQTDEKRMMLVSQAKLYCSAYERKLSARDRFDEMGIDKLWRVLASEQIGIYHQFHCRSQITKRPRIQ